MCVGRSPSAPVPPPIAPEAAKLPTPPPGDTATTADDKRKRAAAGRSDRSTILTSPSGVTDSAATAQKTLLGA